MDITQLAVEIVVAVPGKRPSTGSGCLIAPDLVLTARHVVAAADAEVQVAMADDPVLRGAEVIWRGSQDAALLRLTVPEQAGRPRIRWGRLTTRAPGIECEAVGFPWAQRTDQFRDTEPLHGNIDLRRGLRNGLIQVDVHTSPPVREGDRSGWAGMSGAGLFSAGLLVGIVIWDTPNFHSRRVTAVPVERLVADAGFRTALGLTPVLESVELAPIHAGVRSAVADSPADLLRADRCAVQFRGRGQEIQRLREWCVAPGPALRLLVGPGGQGKTRLAYELGGRLSGEGWLVAYVPPGELDGRACELLNRTAHPVLLIVDYAETRVTHLVALLDQVREMDNPPVRILGIARSAGDWWTTMGYEYPQLDLDGCVVDVLAPLEAEEAGRREAFEHAMADLRPLLGPRSVAELQGAETLDWSDDRLGSALTMQMAALVMLLDGRVDDIGQVERALLRHERGYWHRAAAAFGLNVHPSLRDRAVEVATLCGAGCERDAMTLLASLPGFAEDADRRIRAAMWLRDLYPPTGARYWGALLPDRLAEFLVAEAVRADHELLGRLLSSMEGRVLADDQIEQIFLVLARACAHQPDVRDRLIEAIGSAPHLAGHVVRSAQHARNPGPLVFALTELVTEQGADFDTLTTLSDSFPHQTLMFDELSALVLQHLVAAYREISAEHRFLAFHLSKALSDLSHRLTRLGNVDAALDAVEEAAAIMRPFVVDDPGRWSLDLAKDLHNLAARQRDVGNYDAAFAAFAEASEIYLSLGLDESRDMALLYLGLGALFDESDDIDNAVELCSRAVNLYYRLSHDNPGAHEAEMALALNNLSLCLGKAGQAEEARGYIELSFTIYYRLHEREPDRWLPELGRALHNYALRLADCDDQAAALAAAEQAVAVFHKLAAGRPDAWLGELAGAQVACGACLIELGQTTEALVVLDEAIGLHYKLYELRPAVWGQRLAAGMLCFAQALITEGRQRMAIESVIAGLALARAHQAEQVGEAFQRLLVTAYRDAPEEVGELWESISGRPVPPHIVQWVRAQDLT